MFSLSLSLSLLISYYLSIVVQDYDWRQYASRDDDNERGLSLQSRLAGSHHHHPSASIEVDQSLSGSTSMVSHCYLHNVFFY